MTLATATLAMDSYKQVSVASCKAKETKDCAVKALAITCGVSYNAAHAALKQIGRKDRGSTRNWMMPRAAKLLGAT